MVELCYEPKIDTFKKNRSGKLKLFGGMEEYRRIRYFVRHSNEMYPVYFIVFKFIAWNILVFF